MKNSRYFPYERNRYFYGKLLTVRDFESEQKYMNDKRRLVNRLLHGYGVVSGLQVIAVDDKSISVEMGVALDSMGREIVVPSPVTLKLSTIEGFSNNEYAKNVYLCIAYDEKGKEPVHSVANTSVRAEEVSEYNRLSETYRLFIKEEAPERSSLHTKSLFENTVIIFDDGKVRISQSSPKFVNPGETFEMTVHFEKTLQTPQIQFEFEVESDYFTVVDNEGASSVKFVEPVDAQKVSYDLSYLVKANNKITDTNVKIGMKNNSVKLAIGDIQVDVGADSENYIEIVQESVKERLMQEYLRRTLEQSVASTADQSICLAKINLLQMGPTYIIENIEQVPFSEYVYNASVLFELENALKKSSKTAFTAHANVRTLNRNEEPQFHVNYNDEKNKFEFELALPELRNEGNKITTGIVSLKLNTEQQGSKGLFSKASQNSYFSEEISHGLGNGQVMIIAGFESFSEDQFSDMLSNNEEIYYGDYEVFKDSEFSTSIQDISIGTLLYPKKGKFRIGAKVKGKTNKEVINIRWWAIKMESGTVNFNQDVFGEAASSKE